MMKRPPRPYANSSQPARFRHVLVRVQEADRDERDEPVEHVKARRLEVLDAHEEHAQHDLDHHRRLGDDRRPPPPRRAEALPPPRGQQLNAGERVEDDCDVSPRAMDVEQHSAGEASGWARRPPDEFGLN